MDRKLKQLRWARKLMKSSAFVVLTDKEGFIYLDVIDPEKIADRNVLLAQRAEIRLFIDKLTEFDKMHEEAVERFMPGVRAANIKVKRKRTPTAKKKVTKIPVKQG